MCDGFGDSADVAVMDGAHLVAAFVGQFGLVFVMISYFSLSSVTM